MRTAVVREDGFDWENTFGGEDGSLKLELVSLGGGGGLCSSSGFVQGIEQLVGEGVGEFFFGAVGGGPFFGQVMGAEDSVEPGERGGVVVVDGAGESVVPVVEGGGGDEPFEGAEAETEVGVDEKAPGCGDQCGEDGDQSAGGGFGAAQAQDVDGDQGAESAEDQVDRMGTGVD